MSKIYALVDAQERQIALEITEVQTLDGRAAANMLDGFGAGKDPTGQSGLRQ